MSDEKLVTTICRDCVFAQLEEGVQVGCDLRRLEVFQKRGEASIKSEGDWFWTIDRFCNTCRNEKWAEGKFDLVSTVLREAEIQYSVIIIENAEFNNDETISRIHASCKSALEQRIPPTKIVIGLKNAQIIRHQLSGDLKELFKGYKPNFSIVHIVEDTHDFNKIMNICFDSIDSQFYTVINSGFKMNGGWGDTLNDMLNIDLLKFVMIRPGDEHNNYLTVLNMMHVLAKKLGDRVVEVIEDLAQKNNAKEMILECPVPITQ